MHERRLLTPRGVTPRSLVLVLGLVVTLALPGRAFAVDHVVLAASPTRVGTASAAWRLSATVAPATSIDPTPGAHAIFSVSLARSFLHNRAGEAHTFYPSPAPSLAFDGRRGRWSAHIGNVLTVAMSITTRGAPRPVDGSRGCRGAFAQVPVVLRGRLVFRTGTRLFKTIRRVRLAGNVTFNQGGPLDCTPPPPAAGACTPSSSLVGGGRLSPTSEGEIWLSPDARGSAILSFSDRSSPAGAWYHLMRVSGFDPLAGLLPTIEARLPAGLPIQGSGTFTAQQPTTETTGACRSVSANGAFTGMFRTRFSGWGMRTLALHPADYAVYREDR